MFICEECHEISQPGEVPVQKVVTRREKVYPPRSNANPGKLGDAAHDPGGKGWEIVKMVLVHAECPQKGGLPLVKSYR